MILVTDDVGRSRQCDESSLHVWYCYAPSLPRAGQ